jgi:flagellar biosynthesis/type III secretory pathway protein FliH
MTEKEIDELIESQQKAANQHIAAAIREAYKEGYRRGRDDVIEEYREGYPNGMNAEDLYKTTERGYTGKIDH